jgi:hypothetical protein
MSALDKWQRLVAPTADKLGLPGKMGVPLTLTPDAGKAASELLMQLARLADVQENLLASLKRLALNIAIFAIVVVLAVVL